MRVTSMLPSTQYQMQQTEQTLESALNQISTGRRVIALSDDPAASANMVRSQSEMANVDQYTSNISSLQAQLQMADSAISTVVSTLNSAVSYGTAGASGTMNSAQREMDAKQIETLLATVVSLGNTSFQGQYIFGGAATGAAPFVAASSTFTSTQGSSGTPLSSSTALTAGSVTQISDATTGLTMTFTASAGDTIATLQSAISSAVSAGTLSSGITATINGSGQLEIGTGSSTAGVYVQSNDAALGAMNAVSGTAVANAYAYVGNSTVNTVPVGNYLSVTSNLPGDQLLSSGTNVLSAMNSLITALRTGTGTQIADAVNSVTSALNKVNQVRVPLDNTLSHLNSQNAYLSNEKVTLTSQQNSLVAVDMSAAATNLSQAQIAHSAALAAAAKVLPSSLLDYLK